MVYYILRRWNNLDKLKTTEWFKNTIHNMYFTQIHNYVFITDTHMLEMNSGSILGILIDNLSKKNKYRYRRCSYCPTWIRRCISHYSHYPKVEKYLFSWLFIYVLNCFDIHGILMKYLWNTIWLANEQLLLFCSYCGSSRNALT